MTYGTWTNTSGDEQHEPGRAASSKSVERRHLQHYYPIADLKQQTYAGADYADLVYLTPRIPRNSRLKSFSEQPLIQPLVDVDVDHSIQLDYGPANTSDG